MIYTIPDYYNQFRCLAGECSDTCCAGWQIAIDRLSMRRYGKVRGPFRKRLVKSVNWMKGTFCQTEDKRCAFLNEDNLCDMYTALGKKSLCRTCRLYPRHVEEFEGVREISLSVSCPEAARILLEKMEPVRFLTYEKEREEEFDDFDPLLYSALADARDVIFQILQNRGISVKVRAGIMLGLAHDMQVRMKRGDLFSCGELYGRYLSDAAVRFVVKKVDEQEKDAEECYWRAAVLFGKLYKLELLHEEWDKMLREAEELLYWKGHSHYTDIKKEFSRWMAEKRKNWEIQKEQLLVYFVFTYFCGAVYDGRVYAKAEVAAASVFLIEELLTAKWLKNEKTLDFEDILEIVYRYSREIEHSDKNLTDLEKLL